MKYVVDCFTSADWWYFNKESIALAIAVTAITAFIWPIVHELSQLATQWLIAKFKR